MRAPVPPPLDHLSILFSPYPAASDHRVHPTTAARTFLPTLGSATKSVTVGDWLIFLRIEALYYVPNYSSYVSITTN